MLDIVDSINESILANNHALVSFYVVSMFQNIDNKFSLKSVKDVLLFYRLMARHSGLTCFVTMLTLP